MDAAHALVFAPKEGSGPEYRGLDAWRISFEHVLAMRFGPIEDGRGAWKGTPRPEEFDAGAWEVDPSSWLMQVTPASYGDRPHHYVLTYNDAIYEIAAASWRSEPLPDTWDLDEEMRRGPTP
jgi:hypothetical protein